LPLQVVRPDADVHLARAVFRKGRASARGDGPIQPPVDLHVRPPLALGECLPPPTMRFSSSTSSSDSPTPIAPMPSASRSRIQSAEFQRPNHLAACDNLAAALGEAGDLAGAPDNL